MRWHLFVFVCLLTGCATLGNDPNALKISEIDWSVTNLRKVIIEIIPVGHRAISPNGREVLSRHFVLTMNGYKPAGDALERYYARFIILGDHRPYDIEISVTHEKRVLRGQSFTYSVVGYDMELAKELENKLRDELTKRREDLNIIDDFRVF